MVVYLILSYYRLSELEVFQTPSTGHVGILSSDKRTMWVDAYGDDKKYAYLQGFIDCAIDQLATWKFQIHGLRDDSDKIKFGVFLEDDGGCGGHKFDDLMSSDEYWESVPQNPEHSEIEVTLNTRGGSFRCKIKDMRKEEMFYICNIYASSPRQFRLREQINMKCKLMMELGGGSRG